MPDSAVPVKFTPVKSTPSGRVRRKRAWVKNADYWDVFFENNEKIYKLLPLKGISFPFPQMDVHVKHN